MGEEISGIVLDVPRNAGEGAELGVADGELLASVLEDAELSQDDEVDEEVVDEVVDVVDRENNESGTVRGSELVLEVDVIALVDGADAEGVELGGDVDVEATGSRIVGMELQLAKVDDADCDTDLLGTIVVEVTVTGGAGKVVVVVEVLGSNSASVEAKMQADSRDEVGAGQEFAVGCVR